MTKRSSRTSDGAEGEKMEEQKPICFKCRERIKGTVHYWYHGDQDDRLCDDCAEGVKHTDTAYAGLPVKPVSSSPMCGYHNVPWERCEKTSSMRCFKVEEHDAKTTEVTL